MTDKPKLGRPSDACTVRMALLVTPDEAMAIARIRGDVPLSAWLRAVVRRELGRAGTVILHAAEEKLTTIHSDVKGLPDGTEAFVMYRDGRRLYAIVETDGKTRKDWDYLEALLREWRRDVKTPDGSPSSPPPDSDDLRLEGQRS